MTSFFSIIMALAITIFSSLCNSLSARCVLCSSAEPALLRTEVVNELKTLPDWEFDTTISPKISKKIRLCSIEEMLEFIDTLATVADNRLLLKRAIVHNYKCQQ